jgi:two-component system sensor histidine kinase KdpD
LSPRIVRAAKRLAAGLHAQLIAAFVETPAAARMAAADRERLVQTLRLAESLGAETVTLNGSDAARELVGLAQSRNVSKIVVGKTGLSRWRERWSGSFVNDVMRQSGTIDVYVIRGDADEPAVANVRMSPLLTTTAHSSWREYVLALVVVAVCTTIGAATYAVLESTNIVMLYLLGVVIAATRLGRGPAVCAAVLGVAAFDYFFVPPRLTFAVSDVQYLLTFGVMLVVGLLIATLTNQLRDSAATAQQRERRTSALYATSRELRDVAAVAVRHMHDTFDADVVLLLPRRSDAARTLEVFATHGSPDWFDERERGVAQWSLDHGKTAGAGTSALPSVAGRLIPLITPGGTQGVLAMRAHNTDEPLASQQILLLETFGNQVALALERVALIEGQQAARVEAEAERLRSALLSSVSHDLRTPLATIRGATTSLLELGDAMDEATRRGLLQGIDQEAQRLNELISNLVFATRLDSGSVQLRRDWTTVEEIVGAGLSSLHDRLRSRPFKVLIPSDLPLLRVDGALLPQVFHNLVENALRHTPEGTPVEITAWATDKNIIVRVADEGPGFPVGDEQRVFERFYRGPRGNGSRSENTMGMGLGLTICQGIVRAHEGRIWTENNATTTGARAPGTAVMVSLPFERPQPRMPTEALAHSDNAIVAEGKR